MGQTVEFSRPVTELIVRRTSCRTYLDTPIGAENRGRLESFLEAASAGPFGSPVRFGLIAADDGDPSALKGLGTYGIIKGATGFVVGAAGPGPKNLEDFGYALERIILYAADLELGTCWLGGTFTKSRFAKRFGLQKGEEVPAVASVGFPARQSSAADAVSRRMAGSDRRMDRSKLFFDGDFGHPLSREAAEEYGPALEMVRLAPSASNKQPWRIVRSGQSWHFYMQRARAYRPRALALVGIADMPRIDIGIAMCHFELTAREQGLQGSWQVAAPDPRIAGAPAEYSVTWIGEE